MKPALQAHLDRIGQLYPLCDLAPMRLEQLLQQAELIRLGRGQRLFDQGDTDNQVYFLLTGSLELERNGNSVKRLTGGTVEAQIALAQLQPRKYSAVIREDCELLSLQRDRFELMLKDCASQALRDLEVNDLADEAGTDWENRLLNSPLFEHVPVINIHRIFTLIDSRPVKQGEVLVQQHDEVASYHILQEGLCQIRRRAGAASASIPLCRLSPGDCFDVLALITDRPSEASYVMLSEGRLGSIPRHQFVELIVKPVLRAVRHDPVKDHTVTRLDVSATAAGNNSDVVHIPLEMLRFQLDKLPSGPTYLVEAENSERSAAACLLLLQKGLEVRYRDPATQIEPTDTRPAKTPGQAVKAASEKTSVAHVDDDSRKALNQELLQLRQSLKAARQHLKHQQTLLHQYREKSEYRLRHQQEQMENRLREQARELRTVLTRRQQAEEELRHHNAQLEHHLEHMRLLAQRNDRRDELMHKRMLHKAERLIAEEMQKVKPATDASLANEQAERLIAQFLKDH